MNVIFCYLSFIAIFYSGTSAPCKGSCSMPLGCCYLSFIAIITAGQVQHRKDHVLCLLDVCVQPGTSLHVQPMGSPIITLVTWIVRKSFIIKLD